LGYGGDVPRNPPQPPDGHVEPADEAIRPLKRSELESLKGGADPGPSEPPERDSTPKLPRR